ncbi:hypothetical protein K504DRAFT_7702 [Pleomassaria siparia CBS 279.74]|uniref:polynucleotide adenylyltransferase n=1 Tax=Pleomassaria siparia CBS 279.74 TaxID=1314801 RepID=A0A6G1KQA3_9PLEO|nr:hypothetical protein K504DRAFT_7702 [Pleomassaria siparia CBS 279.74]
MGESRYRGAESTYLYSQHPSAIHLDQRRTNQCVTALDQFPVSLSLQGRPQPPQPQQPPPPPPPPPQRTLQLPPLLLLHPLIHLNRIDELRSNAPSSASSPTVIVSPHYQSPTTERDITRPAGKNSFPKQTPALQQLDGNNGAPYGVHSSAPSMTLNGIPTMGSKLDESASLPRAQRPSVVSQHSNSVPSTPLQLARHYESRSRSPSPNGGLGSHSPRSVSSEANGAMPTLRQTRRVGCKYETNQAFGRRRIPYTSSDILDKAKEEPKKTLDPHEDEKLSGDMRELYDRLKPSGESTLRRRQFVDKLQNILETEWPGNEFKVHVFGSSGNMLYTSDSDVDVCIQTPMTRLEEMHMLAEALAKHGMEKVVCIPGAKVRIVKVWDPVLELACDMNVNNTLALENTRMIKLYVEIDDRVRPLAMIIKHWTKQRILNDAAFGGTISSYTWICMILNFLQTRDPPILPSLHKLPHRSTPGSEFADDLSKVKGFGADNKESLGELLFQFFRRYGHEMDFDKNVVSVREGRLLTRNEKNWHLPGLTKEARNRLCVEEPFNTDRNLGNSADDFAWRGIHLEIRRAFDLLADGGQLVKACEQYEFPPEEKMHFKKPVSSKPTLTSSVPNNRGGRGGGNHRGRGNFNHRMNNHAYTRRSSSGASSFGPSRSPFLNSPPIPPTSAPGQQEYFPRGLNEQLHDQLYQQYQILEMQSNSLRAQLAAQQRAQQAHQQQAHMHAQALAHAQAQAQSRGPSSSNGSPQKSPYINGGRLSPRLPELGIPPNSYPHGFLYNYPGFFDPNQGTAAGSQDGARTNPSSPSLTNSIPGLRRGVHRSSNASDTAASIRSQSQPPRSGQQQPSLLQGGYPPVSQYYDPASFAGYPIARSTQEVPSPRSVATAADIPFSPLSVTSETTAVDHGKPKEYVGYYVAEQPQLRSQLQDYAVPQIPSFTELAHRRRRVSPEIIQPLLNTALRRVSRSPSPLGGHMRSYSTSVAPPSGTNTQPRKDRVDSSHPTEDSGPVIVNGSFPTRPHEPRNRSDSTDAFPPTSIPNPLALGIYLNSADQYQLSTNIEQRQQLVLDELQRQKAELRQTAVVNESLPNPPPLDTNGSIRVSSGGKQSGPVLSESWSGYSVNSSDQSNRSMEVSPTRNPLPAQFRPMSVLHGLRSLDTIGAPREPPQETQSAGVGPLLSPVFETARTPSPTVTRHPDVNKVVNGAKPQSKENHQQQQRRASHSAAQASGPKENHRSQQKGNTNNNNEKGTKSNAGTNSSTNNNWQQQQPKRQNRKKTPKSKQGTETKALGEPLPVNAADRKGG